MIQPFITFRETVEGELKYYVLQKAFPHYLGEIVYNPKTTALVISPVPSYNMYIVSRGTILGNMIPSYRDVENEMIAIYQDMANWFYAERILTNEGRYKKFKI